MTSARFILFYLYYLFFSYFLCLHLSFFHLVYLLSRGREPREYALREELKLLNNKSGLFTVRDRAEQGSGDPGDGQNDQPLGGEMVILWFLVLQ